MKKIISMVMAAAMVLSLVPATAFAAPTVGTVTATAKVVDAFKGSPTAVTSITDTQLQIKVTDAAYTTAGAGYAEFEVVLDNAEFPATVAPTWATLSTGAAPTLVTERADDNTLLIKATGTFTKDQVIKIPLTSKMTRNSAGRTATVSVYSDAVTAEDLVYATSVATGITASTRKTVTVAAEEKVTLHSGGIVIEPTISGSYAATDRFILKLSKGFEFTKANESADLDVNVDVSVDGREMIVTTDASMTDDEKTAFVAGFTLKNIQIEATTAKVGDTATITITAKEGAATNTVIGTASIEVATVVDYTVNLTVDEDDDVPVIYSGTDKDNTGLTSDSNHKSVEVTVEETFPGAWSSRQGFSFTLPEGVYVTDVEIIDTQSFKASGAVLNKTDWRNLFIEAYDKGDYKSFEFAKRIFDEIDITGDVASLSFKLELVADPTFEGEVKLGFEGALVDTQEVTIAKFAKPYTATAEQNDVIIDYRNTSIETPITVVEAEEGLWADNMKFTFTIDKSDYMVFEDDATYTVDSKSGLELRDKDTDKGTLVFGVKTESEDGAATVTISDMELFMQRSIPAGAYSLTVKTSAEEKFLDSQLLGYTTTNKVTVDSEKTKYSQVVNAAFVNVVTAGRDQDGVFTTKIVVPVGEMYIIAGGKTVELDVPAFISASGHTMLPLRAVANALGVDTSSVIWHAASSTVTILYGSKIVTITIGDAYVYVNGAQIPASTPAVIVDGRTFLTLRDLATALGVTDIAWDATTRTATLNGGN